MDDERCVREAGFWAPDADPSTLAVRCALCAHRCHVAEGKRGICGVRENRGGILFTLVYGRLVSNNIDPIEKKPLFHFLPGSLSQSIAVAGCNFRCAHCQNFSISQPPREGAPLPGDYVGPDEVVEIAVATGAESISYTYTEPTIMAEYALDVMAEAHRRGLKNVFVSNGYMTPELMGRMVGLLDAINIDVKSISDEFYRKVCGATLEPVLEAVKVLWESGVWVEATTLIIPGHNDSEVELRELANFIASVDEDLPWHVTGFYPTYKMTDIAPTPTTLLTDARKWGLEEGLHHVYQGNRPGSGGEDTFCPRCSFRVIERRGFSMIESQLSPSGQCPSCGAVVAGVFG